MKHNYIEKITFLWDNVVGQGRILRCRIRILSVRQLYEDRISLG